MTRYLQWWKCEHAKHIGGCLSAQKAHLMLSNNIVTKVKIWLLRWVTLKLGSQVDDKVTSECLTFRGLLTFLPNKNNINSDAWLIY